MRRLAIALAILALVLIAGCAEKTPTIGVSRVERLTWTVYMCEDKADGSLLSAGGRSACYFDGTHGTKNVCEDRGGFCTVIKTETEEEWHRIMDEISDNHQKEQGGKNE